MSNIQFQGEAEAIKLVKELGKVYGYGNMIFHLRNAWSQMLQDTHQFPADTADRAAGHICPWCDTDSRTGEKASKQSGE